MCSKMIRSTRTVISSFTKTFKLSVRYTCFPANYLNYLRSLPGMQYSKLPNGPHVVTEERDCCNVCIGYFIDGGSRYEKPDENGISHFFEHLVYKGTAARTKTVLEDLMSSTGARFRAFTTREMVGFYCDCMSCNVPSVFSLLTDCIFNNSLSPCEIELQKETVYLEMLEHEKNIRNIVDDHLHATAFQGTPLAQTVMGPSSNLYKFNETTIAAYRKKTLDPNNIVLSAVGGITHDQILHLAMCIDDLPSAPCMPPLPYRYTGSEMTYRDDTLPFAHVAIAVEGAPADSSDSTILKLAASLVGGWDKSQGGGINIGGRTARGASTSQLCDSYEAINIAYKDTGLWGAQFIAPKLAVDEMVSFIQGEWMRLCVMLPEGELERAKAELITKVLTDSQSTTKTCLDIGQWILYNKYTTTLYETVRTIQSIKLREVRDVCNKYIYDKCPAVASVGSTECLPDYTRVRAGMYWLRY